MLMSISETKIDRIESRLANIEQLLRDQTNATSSGSTEARENIANAESDKEEHDEVQSDETADDLHMRSSPQGELGLRNESIVAKQVLEEAIDRDGAIRCDPQLISALDSLKVLINHTKIDAPDPPRASVERSGVGCSRKSSRPSWKQVKPLLEQAKSEPSALMLVRP